MSDSSANTDQGSSQSDSSKDTSRPRASEVPPSKIALTVQALSALLVIGLVAYLAFKALMPDKDITFRYDLMLNTLLEHEGRYSLDVNIRNEGSAGISYLKFDVAQGADQRTAELFVLGPGESKVVNLWLDHDPRSVPLEFTTRSYVE